VVVVDSGNAATVLDVLNDVSGARGVVVTTIGRTVVVVVVDDVDDVDEVDVVVVTVAGLVTMLAGELVVGAMFWRSVVVVVRRDCAAEVDVVVAEGTTVDVGKTVVVDVVVVVEVVVDVVVVVVVVAEGTAVDVGATVVVVVGVGTLFVTDVAASVAASLPAESCTAFTSFPTVGSVYATVTDSPAATADPSVNTTVEPDTTTGSDTLRDTPPTVTANADVAAVVADNASEYVNAIVVPSVLVAADTNVGERVSTVDAFVTEVEEIDATSLPLVSCTAFVSSEPLGSL